ncbi:MAG: amidohydrolase [Balneolaceae bacterium]
MYKVICTFILIFLMAAAEYRSVDIYDPAKADYIIVNGLILTMNQDKDIIDDGVVVIQGDTIADIGGPELLDQYEAEVIDADGGIIMPGMINTHTHLAMSLFRSLGDDVPDRLTRFIFPLEDRMVSEEMVYKGTKHSAIELLKGGVTTLVDMYLFEASAAEAVKDVGLRGIMTQNIIRFPTADGASPDETIERAVKLIETYQDDELITPGFAPHGTHTVSREDLIRIRDLAEKYDVPVSMHVAETEDEFEEIQSTYGMTPIEYLDSIGLINERFIAAHTIFATDEDIVRLKDRNAGVAHNMIANIKSAKGVAPAYEMYNSGVRIGLGTDGPMSANSLDLIRQMGYVSTLQKYVHGDRSLMPAVDVVDMATMGGARALHMEERIGSLETGKLADIIIVETKSTNMIPMYDPYSVLVYSATAANVETVMVNGRLLLKNRKVLHTNEEEVTRNIRMLQDEVNEIVKELE